MGEDPKKKDAKKDDKKKGEVKEEEDTTPIPPKGHLNRLIGPLRINLQTTSIEQFNEMLEEYLKTKEKKLFEYFTAGYEVNCKYKLLEDVAKQMRKIHDWRQ